MDIITGALVSSCVICTFNGDIQFGHVGWPPDVPVAAISTDRVQRTPEHLEATPLDDGGWSVRFSIKRSECSADAFGRFFQHVEPQRRGDDQEPERRVDLDA